MSPISERLERHRARTVFVGQARELEPIVAQRQCYRATASLQRGAIASSLSWSSLTRAGTSVTMITRDFALPASAVAGGSEGRIFSGARRRRECFHASLERHDGGEHADCGGGPSDEVEFSVHSQSRSQVNRFDLLSLSTPARGSRGILATPRKVSKALGFAVLGVALGCGGDDDASPGASFTLQVSAPAPTGSVPLPGAVVAVDQADGSRKEGSTGPDGSVTIAGIDLSQGAFSFTVAAAGYIAVSSLHHTQAGAWRITLARLGSADSGVALTGIVRGKRQADHFLAVSTTASSTTFSGVGPEYSLHVPANQPFQAIVAEYGYGPAPRSAQGSGLTFFGWSTFPVRTGPQASVLDLVLPGGTAAEAPSVTGQSLEPSTASGTLLVPRTMTGARGALRVSSHESNQTAYLGAGTLIDLASNGTDLHYDAEYVSPPGSSLTTEYWISLDDTYSYAFRDAPPGNDVSLIDPPNLASPLSLYGSLPLANPTLGTQAWINIERDDRTVVWRVYGGESGGFHMPKLPSAIDPRTVLGTGRMTARPQNCRLDASGKLCSEIALGASADLVGP
jgi:hypothetical protein